ncbi:MAG: bifunctional methylenetetrahydrofolate dehydrogenase/methenyltetrahydrofolate cyclohydrolase FolD [Chlamydiia bacterium]|nr:bifunctional methylenetetrahydrofolate dehydrogenase/methenyltetrahydrofolate cyclohydrolase FolD [Chlamydiia bacterium]
MPHDQMIDGTRIAAKIRGELKEEIAKIDGRKPGLAFVLIGKDPGSQTYVRMKKKGCEEVGILSKILSLPESISQSDLEKEIVQLNQEEAIDGILIQQPFPKQISPLPIIRATLPRKDVDGFHPENIGRLLLGEKGGHIACTPLGIMELLKRSKIETAGKEAVIVGRSNIVGKPLAALLMQKGADATVTVAHSKTKDLELVCRRADILIAAIGRPHFITAEMVKEGATVIDVGINRTEKGLVGDVDFEGVKHKVGALTPVPGGVGPMTIAMLLSNTLAAYQCRNIS